MHPSLVALGHNATLHLGGECGDRDLCEELGATWLYATSLGPEWKLDPERISAGPDGLS